MAPFPLAKLGFLAIKQISKPIANSIKHRAKANPFFRKHICMPPAQIYHWFETNFRLRMMGLGSAMKVEPLPEKEAIELGGDMLGEFIVFGIAVVVLFVELQRQSYKDKAKEEVAKREAKFIATKLDELSTVVTIQKAQIRDLHNQVEQLNLQINSSQKQQPKKTSWFSGKEST